MTLGQASEAPGGVIAREALACLRRCRGVIQKVTILGHKQKEQTINQTQELTVIILLIEFSRLQISPECSIGRMCQKATPESFDGLLNTIAQPIKGSVTLFLSRFRPPFEPAFFGLLRFHTGLMTKQPQHDEVSIDFVFHHAFEIELDKGLSGQADVITQNPQPQTVGDKTPEMVVTAIQELLHQAVRTGASRSGHACGAAVEVQAVANQVDRTVVPEVGNSLALAFNLDGSGCW